MQDDSRPTKRAKFDLTDTFDVVVGKPPSSQRFTVYTTVLTLRSDFLDAARKPEWLQDPAKPTDLQDEDPDTFANYLACVYFGIEGLRLDIDVPGNGDPAAAKSHDDFKPDTFELSEAEIVACNDSECVNQCVKTLVSLYLLADRLRDRETANLVIDEVVHLVDQDGITFGPELARPVYDSTAHGNPLRRIVRDSYVYDSWSDSYTCLHADNHHPDLWRDVAVEYLRLKDSNSDKRLEDVYYDFPAFRDDPDKYHYHQHSESHPRCVT